MTRLFSLTLLICALQWTSCSEVQKLQRHARKGNAESINLLIQYYMGVGKDQDLHKALHWAKKGTELNDPDAMLDLAYLVGPDSQNAWTLIQKAAKLGSDKAMHSLGMKYLNRKNNDSAFYWINQAILAGNEHAYGRMAEFHYKGIGAKQNYPLALYYYKKGCDKEIYDNYLCCDSVISLLETKLKNTGDTLDLFYWKQRKNEVVIPFNYK